MTTSDSTRKKEEARRPAILATNELQSIKLTHRLNQINRVRANGIGDYISLPQLVVCGDQSSGKSSVLEGITGIPFPRADGLCTRFATEIILRHDLYEERICATIIPNAYRTQADRESFRSYYKELADFSELPRVITEAKQMMRLRGTDGALDGPSFSADILRIEVIGRTGLHLTVVDLPGLISVANDEQSDEDVDLVSQLVDSYVESSRTIILAVVQANNDIANQRIIQKARKLDPHGQRTVGIITKPDLVNRGTEGRIALLAKNKDTTKLKLGFFLLKNPTPLELDADLSLEERKRRELSFFASRPWKEQHLDPERVGIDALTSFLQHLLSAHIERELPKVRSEVSSLLAATERELEAMGEERPTVNHHRMFLTRLSMQFFNLARAALDGSYLELESGLSNGKDAVDISYRLRAQVHVLNGSFSDTMRRDGRKWKSEKNQTADSAEEETDDEEDVDDQGSHSEKDFESWIKRVYMRTRGRELPGNYNHLLLAELFQEQSSPWENIARKHVAKVIELVDRFVTKVLASIVGEEEVRAQVRQYLSDKLDWCARNATEELAKLLADEKRHPSTYNHYFTDNIQRSRQDSVRTAIQTAMKNAISQDWGGSLHISNTSYDRQRFFDSLNRRIVVDMDKQACDEAKVGLEAYYKVNSEMDY
ncbi:hypothetical protein MPH_09187 [Macrophomina phaseolina MS6]|uniref:Dynamin-type G domain-containing protein n=1 Tax=Macrophomina phaseolina (strain MS6) TaxID=1126212 RepID=K2QVH9_MACPH|nr:hypothetical protein MPH_09187 [Macrophomina phaseolina MS6]